MAQTFVYIGNLRAGAQLSQKLVEAGMQAASEIESADVVVTYLCSIADQEDAFFGTDGIVARANPGTCLVDLSPTTPLFARELHAMAAVNGLHMVEAPLLVHDVTLRRAFSQAGNLSLLVSGESGDIEAASQVLRAISADQQHFGAVGEAQAARCAFTVTRIGQVLALAEAQALAGMVEGGREDALERVLDLCDAQPWVKSLAHALRTRTFDGSYTVEMACGEIESALEAAQDIELYLPHAEAAEYLLEMLEVIGGADMPIALVALLYAEESVAASHGLDWSRAEHLIDQHDHHHHGDGVHHHDDDGDGLDFLDEDDYFGDYSAN